MDSLYNHYVNLDYNAVFSQIDNDDDFEIERKLEREYK